MTSQSPHPRTRDLAEDHRTPAPAADPERELDAEIEELTRQIAELVNGAGTERRQDLREYAIELLRERTEVGDAPRTGSAVGTVDRTNPLGMAILLGLVSLPLLFLFLPVGLTMLAVAVVMGLWGILATIFRRRPTPR